LDNTPCLGGDPAAGKSKAAEGQAAILALDGGNSKTDVALIRTDGVVLASVRGSGINSQEAGAEPTVHALDDLVRRVTRRGGEVPVLHTVACLANADLPEEEEELAAAVLAAGWSQTSTVINDTFAILRSGLRDDEPHWGAAVVCGAGINAVGVAPDGRVTRFLALGQLTGDWGGGYGLGREVMWHAIRGEDGRGPATALTGCVREFFNADKVEDVAIAIHKGKIADGDLNGLAPILLRASADGDAVARSIVGQLADEISILALTAMRRLGMTSLRTPVVLGGGVITAGDSILLTGIADRISASAPNAEIRVIDVPPVVGAALLALDHIQAPPAAEARLRAALRRSAE
jgi:N-acetylglucosamine kinase-like BadF-type ATPase